VLPDTDYASITVLHADGWLETVDPTNELVWVSGPRQSHVSAGQDEFEDGFGVSGVMS
jgi:hypothetical protein